MTWDDAGPYVEIPEGTEAISHGVSHQWNHALSEIITALLEAGLTLGSFEETTASAWCPWPELMVRDGDTWRLREEPDRLPLQFVITAHRPA